MRRRKLQQQPHLQGLENPWRWSIGGPIIDFADEGMNAGPSRSVAVQHSDDESTPAKIYSEDGDDCGATRRPLVASSTLAFTAAIASMAWLPLATAAPPRRVRELSNSLDAKASPATPTPTPTTKRLLSGRNDESPPPLTVPTNIPTTATEAVAETMLPYYLSHSQDGNWYKINHAWLMYGREASADTDSATTMTSTTLATPGPAIATYAVVSALPYGWGQSNNRSSFYKVPLIATASVILALVIVAGVIFITLQRRKEQRRKKRHEARMRRKALAAAGLTEDDMNDDDELHVAFKERLAELEKAHQAKRRKAGSSSVVRTKVRVWNRGLRRRKPPPKGEKEKDQAAMATESSPAVNSAARGGSVLGFSRRKSNTSGSITDSATISSARSSVDTVRSSSTASPPMMPTESTHSTLATPDNVESAQNTTVRLSPPPVIVPHMPPAYRPASVRSIQPSTVSSSSQPSGSGTSSSMGQSGLEVVEGAVLSREKVAAAGFYPAPVNEDAEIAQAIANRADAKRPIILPPDDEEEREQRDLHVRHVATDDKRELERLRLGASAPPVIRAENEEVDDNFLDEDEAGPSAPIFAVDESGFEVLPVESSDLHADSDVHAAAPSLSHTGVPLPPQRAPIRSLRTFDATAGPLTASSAPLGVDSTHDYAHLIPSAPPVLDTSPLPSAPGLQVDDEVVPSAPSFDDVEEEAVVEEESERQGVAEEEIIVESEAPEEGPGHVEERGVWIGNGLVFLPRYEP